MSTYMTVEARVWEADCYGPCYVIGILGVASYVCQDGQESTAVTTAESAAKAYAEIVRDPTLRGRQGYKQAMLDSLDYAFPGCATAAGEGGAS